MGPITTPLSRAQAIGRLREAMIALTDDEHSMCRVASEKGIFCRGFRGLSEKEFRDRYDWLVTRHPKASREEIERLANTWELARQLVDRVPLSCDAQLRDHDTCNGWNDFTNEDLERFCREILHKNVRIG
jgi:hypothetical protein